MRGVLSLSAQPNVSSRATRALSLVLLALPAACSSSGTGASPSGAASHAALHSAASAPAPSASAPPSASADASASAEPSVSAEPTPKQALEGIDAGADVSDAALPYDPKNKVLPPADSAELQARAKQLFEAIVADDPPKGDGFWFPKEPFLPLKDVKGPDKYWDQLHRTFAADVRRYHKKGAKKGWADAKFVKFELGSKPKWVPPGDEANKIGYYRSFHGKLRYEQGGEARALDVHTVISWQGRWFITHLDDFKKKKK